MIYKRFIFNLLCSLAAFICLISMYVYPEVIRGSAKEALGICAFSLVPALFPYITGTRILCELVCRSTSSKNTAKKGIFGFSRVGFIAHLLGIISGFPSGALIAGDFYESGIIEKKQAERIISFSNCISPAFCIIIVGGQIIKSYCCGLILFFSVLISNWLCMLILSDKETQKPQTVYSSDKNRKRTEVSSIIKDCGMVMLNICAFVTFFICISNLLIHILGKSLTLSNEIKVVISSVLEISAGMSRLSSLSFGKRILIGSMMLSFGGASSIMQVISVCNKYFLSARKFIVSKFLSLLISPIITFLIFLTLPEWIFSSHISFESLSSFSPKLLLVSSFIIFIFTLILLFCRKIIKNRC